MSSSRMSFMRQRISCASCNSNSLLVQLPARLWVGCWIIRGCSSVDVADTAAVEEWASSGCAADVHDRDARSVAPGEPGHAPDDAVDESDSSVGGIASGVIGQLGIRLCASEGGAADEGEVWQPGHGSHTTAPEAI